MFPWGRTASALAKTGEVLQRDFVGRAAKLPLVEVVDEARDVMLERRVR